MYPDEGVIRRSKAGINALILFHVVYRQVNPLEPVHVLLSSSHASASNPNLKLARLHIHM